VEVLGMNSVFWRGKRVLITGHTGFKGGWLCLWLQAMGAEVHGFALPPPTSPNLWEVARIEETIASSTIADLGDYDKLLTTIKTSKPEVVFHLAAQSLVRCSYRFPVETYRINVLGVVHLLEAVRETSGVKALVNVTTDKCYENREWVWSYRENEPLGGYDPYSSSKACAELITAAYRNSFLTGAGIGVATARAGNVIGGGDWATDRLVPDFFRALDGRTPLIIRFPEAVRPWQHVLEPLSGYILLAERLHTKGAEVAEAWNFGPSDEDSKTVRWIINQLSAQHPEVQLNFDLSSKPHESSFLTLDSSKARTRLGWTPRWNVKKSLQSTLQWHHAWREKQDMRKVTFNQILDYLN
jgi:CDP-glucose 4,6-dehydratase